MTTLASKISEVQAALETLARQHKVPGASLGVMHGDEVVEFVTGTANLNTDAPVTTSTLFQIGSNTKLYTATLVMQLVDDGLIDLDAPVKKYLPSLQLADKKARDAVTVRMLLTHTSGIEGDVFRDGGRGDDGIENYVNNLGDIGQIYAPNEMWSYCNTGWNILGHLVEKLRGQTYGQVMKEKLLAPIGALTTTVFMEEMMAHSCAVGHVLRPGTSVPIVPPMVMMSPSHAPAGSMTVSTPAQILRFVRMHLDSGRTRDGTQVLSAESTKAMQQPQVKMPSITLGKAMGLGWMIDEWDGERVLGHGGNTIGQASFLKLLPDRRFAVTLLTNCTTGGLLWRDVARYLFTTFADVHPVENPKAPAQPPKIDLSKYTGTFAKYGTEITVKKRKEGGLVASILATGELSDGSGPEEGNLAPVDREIFLLNYGGDDIVVHFIDFDRNGRPKYLHAGARVSRRVEKRAKPTAKSKAKAKARPKAKAKAKAAKRKPVRAR